MSPCIARDGALALSDVGDCVSCEERPRKLAMELAAATAGVPGPVSRRWDENANFLKELVLKVTQPEAKP